MHPAARDQFRRGELTYLDTATYGLPPAGTVAALERALASWRDGTARWDLDWDAAGEPCRELGAEILGAPAAEVALVPAVSVAVGVVLAQLAPGEEVVVPDDEFASVLLPALVAAEHAGVKVTRAPFEGVAAAVGPSTALVMTSHVRSNDGRVQDVEAVAAAARDAGAAVLLDASHSAGILPVRASELGLDYVVVSAYKHLLCPRGVAFFSIARPRWSSVRPIVASWRSAADPYGDSFYGGDLSALSPTASRYDVSLAWHAWVGALESLRFVCSVAEAERERWAVGLADLLASRLGVKPSGSSVLSVAVRSTEAAERAVASAGIVAAPRAGKVRLSFHLYNDEVDVELASRVLSPLVAGDNPSG